MIHGILDLAGRDGGFLRRREASYSPAPGDARVGSDLIRRLGLRPGDEVEGEARPGGRGAPTLERVTAVNGSPPETLRDRPGFTSLGAVHPRERLRLESDPGPRGQPDPTARVIDLLCPFGKGQRALIVAPAKAGKTTVLQRIIEGVGRNHP